MYSNLNTPESRPLSASYTSEFDNIRIVQIEKPVNGLGFNIVGGEVDHQGKTLNQTYVHYIGVHFSVIEIWLKTGGKQKGGQNKSVRKLIF